MIELHRKATRPAATLMKETASESMEICQTPFFFIRRLSFLFQISFFSRPLQLPTIFFWFFLRRCLPSSLYIFFFSFSFTRCYFTPLQTLAAPKLPSLVSFLISSLNQPSKPLSPLFLAVCFLFIVNYQVPKTLEVHLDGSQMISIPQPPS